MPTPTRPTDEVEWASSGTALKLPVNGTQKDRGWDTSDGTVAGVPEKPILQYQNGWQNGVYNWINYYDQVLPNPAISQTIFKWDYTFGTGDEVLTDIYINGSGNLELLAPKAINNTGIYANSDRSEFFQMGLWMQFIYDLNRGLAITFEDASAVKWTIKPLGFVDKTSVFLSGGSTTGNIKTLIEFIPGLSQVEIYKDYVLVSDFTDFDDILTGVDKIAYCEIFEGISVTPGATEQLAYQKLSHKRRRFHPLLGSYSDEYAYSAFGWNFFMPLEADKMYRMIGHINAEGPDRMYWGQTTTIGGASLSGYYFYNTFIDYSTANPYPFPVRFWDTMIKSGGAADYLLFVVGNNFNIRIDPSIRPTNTLADFQDKLNWSYIAFEDF